MGMAVTGAHFLVVRVPELFSRFFGDQIGSVGGALGAQDKRHVGAQLQIASQNPKN